MITIDLGTLEFFDDSKREFIYLEGGLAKFEYTLKALYEWEGKWKKPFLKGGLTQEEQIDFYRMMALQPIDERFFSNELFEQLAKYIGQEETATTFSDPTGQNGPKGPPKKTYTAEEIYALMFEAGIDLEFENRNLNRLLVILKVIGNHNTPPKKMSKEEVLRQNAALNAKRKAQMKTKG